MSIVINAKCKLRAAIVAAVALFTAISFGCNAGDVAIVPGTSYVPSEWFDFYAAYRTAGEYPWASPDLELTLDEFPETVFKWTPMTMNVTATDGSGSQTLFAEFLPVWNVILADLNGDGLPELCATVSAGFGVIYDRVIVYDYAGGNTYQFEGWDYYDYALSLYEGRLVVTQYYHRASDVRAEGELAIIDGALVAVGIDRTGPDSDFDSKAREAFEARDKGVAPAAPPGLLDESDALTQPPTPTPTPTPTPIMS